MQRIIFILFFFLALHAADAQEYNYLQYTVADGMPSNTVYDVKQDKEGFIWLATDAGVTRFDGRKFVTFTQKDGLPSNDIIILYCDKFNRVWMVPMHNSVCYFQRGKIHNYKNDSILSKMRFPTMVSYIAETKNGDVAFQSITSGNLSISLVLTTDNKIINPKQPESNFSMGSVGSGDQPDEFRYCYYDTINKIASTYIYKVTEDKFRPVAINGWRKNSDYVTRYKIQNGKRVLIDSTLYPHLKNLAMWDVRSDKVLFYEKSPNVQRIASLMNDDSHTVFQATHDGVYMNDSVTGKIVGWLAPGKICNRVFIDREKNIWISTHTDGVLLLPNKDISTISVNQPNDNIIYLHKKGNTVFAGGTHGNLYTLENNKIKQYNLDYYIQFANNQDQINKINWIEPASDALILGSDDFILKYYPNKKKHDFSKVDVIKSMSTIGTDSILVATGRRTVLMNSRTLKILDTIWPHRSYSGHKSGNAYYIGTPGGLLKVTPGQPMVPMQNIYPDLQALVNNIHKEPDGSFWMSTTGNGVIRMRNDSIIQIFNAANGLLSDNCKSLFLDQKFVWVGTEKGLNRIDRLFPSAPIVKYTIEDGLAANDIHSILSDSGKLYLGTAGKISIFDTSVIKRPSICNLILLSMEGGKRALNADSLPTLRYNENSLRFEFTGLSFRSSKNITYYYRLNGFSDTWDSTLNTTLEFLALPPGDYKLEIFARNKFGINSKTIIAPFIITPPFWNTWWFRILVGAILVAIVWWIVLRRIRLEQVKSITQNRINELEQLALRSQMNPHFIFNCLNSIQNFLLQNNFEKTNEYLTSFAHLIRQTLDNSSRSAISIDSEARYLSSYLELESMRFGHSFVYEIEVDPAIDGGNTYIPTMILQPYVENSIRHGLRYRQDGVKNVSVHFKKRGNTLVCLVEDNGIGRKKASELKSFMHVEYQSKGMTLTAERIAALNRRQDIPITVDVIDLEEDGNATGTQVIVRFPNVFL